MTRRAPPRPEDGAGSMATWRPEVMGTRHVVAAGHHMAAQAGFAILEAGGNAVDAGVASCVALAVLQSEMVNVAGVAPMMIYCARTQEVITISGLGSWPRAATLELFAAEHGGRIPQGILRTVIPAAPAAWIRALQHYGTMGFGEVAAAAIDLAARGFPMYPLMAARIAENAADFRRWPSSAAIYLPGGAPPRVGEIFVQADLARSLQYMADQERAALKGGRVAGLQAARDAFYRGDLGRTIVAYHRQHGGLLSMEDLAEFRVGIESPVCTRFAGMQVYACGPWCQGPVLLQMLNILDGVDLRGLGHNSPAYLHHLLEAMKLAFADRERFYGDPRFVDVPMAALLSADYAALRRSLCRPGEAWPGLPPPGDPLAGRATASAEGTIQPAARDAGPGLDTSYTCAVDAAGNIFSATPSDVANDTPVIPGTGFCPSSRGSQSWAVPGHASCVAPGKRPRLTPNPGLAIKPGEFALPYGTPGGDIQPQAMLQTLLNVAVFGMELQEAVEQPRVGTLSFPNSFEPHAYMPGRINLESRLAAATGDQLAAWGHDVDWWPEGSWRAGSVCMIKTDQQTGVKRGAADPRRQSYAIGW